MPFETLDQYSADAATDLGGSRGLIGKVMTFGGFIILGNALVITLLFRHLISFRTQLICTVGGGIIGVLGMLVRGNKPSQIRIAAVACVAAIAAALSVSLLEARFGLIGLVAVAVIGFLVIRTIEERAWSKL